MRLHEYKQWLAVLPCGERLPTADYVFREAASDYAADLNRIIAALEAQHRLGAEFNVIKFRSDELKLSFLSYPGFMEDPHSEIQPARSSAIRRREFSVPIKYARVDQALTLFG